MSDIEMAETANHSNGDNTLGDPQVKTEAPTAEENAIKKDLKTDEESVNVSASVVGVDNTESVDNTAAPTIAATNGEKSEAMDATSNENLHQKYEENKTYQFILSKGLSIDVSIPLMQIFEELGLTTEEFDERAIELLATFPVDQGKFIVKELRDSRLYGVQNKPQYLMSVMRNFKDRLRAVSEQQAMSLPLIPGPNPDNIKELIDRTGYNLEITVGQRKYYVPEENPNPSINSTGGCIYIGQIPRDVYEDSLVSLFGEIGKIHDLRIMMDPINGKSRGYAFLIYFDKEHAAQAAKKYDGHNIQPGKALKVNVSVANTRLFIGNIPKSKSKDEILEEMKKHAEGVADVIIYSNPDAHDSRKNRGFCFVDFIDHKAASDAKRRISMGKIRPWNNDLVVDWAEQQEEPDAEVMSQVKVLYVRNLKEAVTEESLKELFEAHGEVDKVKKIKDYAFVHFKERNSAVVAMEALKGTKLEENEIEISLAKPQADQKKKKPGFAMGKRGGPGMMGMGARGARIPYGMDYGGYAPAPRGGRGGAGPRGGGYNTNYPQYPMSYTPGPYDYYPPAYGGGAYASGYDMYGGGGGGYPPDPYYGGPGPSYGGVPPPPRGGTGGYPRGGGRGGGSRGGRGYGGAGNRGALKRGGRGSKRTGGDFGGPASKRGGRVDDFSSDIPMNMF